MTKKLTLLLLPLLCLTACGSKKLTGKYSFSMGKDQETHIGLYVDLTEEKYIVDDVTKGNKLALSLEVPEGQSISGLEIIQKVMSENVATYYNVNDKVVVDGLTKIDVAADIKGEVLGNSVITIPTEVFNYGFLVFADGEKLNATLPVSMDDLKHQLVWYGLYIDIGTFTFEVLDEKLLPGPKGNERFGTHPEVTKDKKTDQVAEMNNAFVYTFSNTKAKKIVDSTKVDWGYIVAEETYPNGDPEEEPMNLYFLKDYKTNEPLINQTAAEAYINGVTCLITTDEKGKVTSLTDKAMQKVNLDNLYEDEFVFRNYHALTISLTKAA